MSVSWVRPLACLCALSAFIACASNQQYASSSAAGTVDLAAYPVPPLGARELQLLHQMSDANILGHIELVDSLEIAVSDTVLRLTRSDPISNFAKMMIANHSTNLDQNRRIAKANNILPTTSFGELNAMHVAPAIDSIRIASDLTVDRRYVMTQIALHQHVLAELQELQNVAQTTAVRDQIAATIPIVRDHLSRAHAIAIDMGLEKKRG